MRLRREGVDAGLVGAVERNAFGTRRRRRDRADLRAVVPGGERCRGAAADSGGGTSQQQGPPAKRGTLWTHPCCPPTVHLAGSAFVVLFPAAGLLGQGGERDRGAVGQRERDLDLVTGPDRRCQIHDHDVVAAGGEQARCAGFDEESVVLGPHDHRPVGPRHDLVQLGAR